MYLPKEGHKARGYYWDLIWQPERNRIWQLPNSHSHPKSNQQDGNIFNNLTFRTFVEVERTWVYLISA